MYTPLEQRIEELEKKVDELEGRVPVHPEEKFVPSHGRRLDELGKKADALEGQVAEQLSVTVDYQEANLKKLIITNDKEIYEDMKTDKNIGVLFDPIVFSKSGFNPTDEIYVIGILQDK